MAIDFQKDPSKNFNDNAGRHGQLYLQDYRNHINKLASRELFNEWKRNLVMSSTVCIWNYIISDSSALFLFAPLVVLCLIPVIIDLVSVRYGLILKKYASLYLDLILIYAAFSISFFSGWVTKHGILDVVDGPVQGLLILLGWYGHKVSKYSLLFRNLLIITLSVITVSALDTEFSVKIMGQFIVGGLLLIALGEGSRKKLLRDFYGSYLHRSRNDHYHKEMKKSYYPHQLEAMKLKHNLEETMITEPGMGIVQEVDIIASSEFKDPKFFEFKQKAFKAMYNEGMADYQLEASNLSHPIGSCYKFKEMGDGFYNTFGYPFRFPDESDGALGKTVFEHSLRLFEIWEEVFKDTGIKAHLAITLGRNMLHGFWTHPPGVVYDIHQDGVVKTARISSIRRKLQELRDDLRDCHLIIAEKEVIDSLPKHLKEIFEIVNLSELGLMMRGFKEIENLYIYQLRFGVASKNSA